MKCQDAETEVGSDMKAELTDKHAEFLLAHPVVLPDCLGTSKSQVRDISF